MPPRRSLADAATTTATLVIGCAAPVAILAHTPAQLTSLTVLLVLVWLGIPLHAMARLITAARRALAERSAYRRGADLARRLMIRVAFNAEARQVGRRS